MCVYAVLIHKVTLRTNIMMHGKTNRICLKKKSVNNIFLKLSTCFIIYIYMLIYLLDNDDDDVPHPICAESENICEHKKYRWIKKKKK